MSKQSIEQIRKDFMRLAEDAGCENDPLFKSTLNRYLVQLGILDKLEQKMEQDGMLVEKEYVKGSKNLYSSPAVTEYNKTTDSANKTVSTLLRIIKANGNGGNTEEQDPLMGILRGGDKDGDGESEESE